MADHPIFDTPPTALAELRSRTGWTAARANRWLRDVARYGRRSPHFDADRLVALLREAKDAGASTLVIGPAIGEGDSTVARWVRGTRPRPTTDSFYVKAPCSVRGCSKPRIGAKDICFDHYRSEYRAEYRAEYAATKIRGSICRFDECGMTTQSDFYCAKGTGHGHANLVRRLGAKAARAAWARRLRMAFWNPLRRGEREPVALYGVIVPQGGMNLSTAKMGKTSRRFAERWRGYEVPFLPVPVVPEWTTPYAVEHHDAEIELRRYLKAAGEIVGGYEWTSAKGLQLAYDWLVDQDLDVVSGLWTPPEAGELVLATASQAASVARTA